MSQFDEEPIQDSQLVDDENDKKDDKKSNEIVALNKDKKE